MSRNNTITDRYVEWWYGNLPPLGGILRAVFYTGLLVLSLWHPLSPLRGLSSYEVTHPDLIRTYGLMDWLGIRYVPAVYLRVVVAFTVTAWVFVGLIIWMTYWLARNL